MVKLKLVFGQQSKTDLKLSRATITPRNTELCDG